MKADIKRIHTIAETRIVIFNKYLSDIVNDLQTDGLEVEIQYQFKIEENYDGEGRNLNNYSALIIGRGK